MNATFSKHDLNVREQARRAFRQRRRIRKSFPLLALATTAMLGCLIFSSQRGPDPLPLAVATIEPKAQAPAEIHAAVPAERLTDEDLLAKFPPGSCFIAEVNGNKILVFTDPTVEKAYFQ